MSARMRAMAVAERDSGLSLLELPVPEPAEGELLVRVHASSINPIDVYVARGTYPAVEYDRPVVPGWDFSGVVERVGDGVEGFEPGDEVLGYWSKPTFRDGAWAEYVAIPADGAVAKKPARLGFEEAAAVPLAAVTALIAVEGVAPGAGEPVLVVGAGGAVGCYAVQLAAQAGAHVIATAKPGDEERVLALGASETIDYTSEDLVAVVRARYPDGIAALIDIVNDRPVVTELAELVREGGHVASARFAADRKVLPARGIGVTNVKASDCDSALLERVVELVEAGELQIMIDDVRPLEELPAAVEEFARGGRGKIVISVGGDGRR